MRPEKLSLSPKAKDNRGNFRFVVDLEWDKLTGYFDNELEYEDIVMDHKYYIDSIYNRTQRSTLNEGIKQPDVEYAKGIRTFVLGNNGQITDKAEILADEDNAALNIQSMRIGLGIEKEVQDIENANEAMVKAIRHREQIATEDDSFGKLDFGSVFDSRASIRNVLQKKIGTGGAGFFIVTLSLFLLFQIATVIAYWSIFDTYAKDIDSFVGIVHSISQLETHLSRVGSLTLIVGMANRGVSFPPFKTPNGNLISMSDKIDAYSHELRLAIEDLETTGKDISNSLYLNTDVQNMWIEGRPVSIVNINGGVEQNMSIANSLRAVIGASLGLKNGNMTNIDLSDVNPLYLIRNSLGALLSRISDIESSIYTKSQASNTARRQSSVIFAALQLCGGIVLAACMCIASARVNRGRSRMFKVFYTFTTATLDRIVADVCHHHESIKAKDASAVMAVGSDMRDMMDADDMASGGRMAVQAENAVSKRYWNRVVNKRVYTSAVDACCLVVMIGCSVMVGIFMLKSATSDWDDFDGFIAVADHIHRFGQHSSIPVTAFTLGLAKDLNLDFPIAAKYLKNPKEALIEDRSTFWVHYCL